MSRLKEAERTPSDREFIFPCDCGDHGHYLRFRVDLDDPDYRFMWIEYTQGTLSLWDRFKMAWNILLGRDVVYGEVLLTELAIDGVQEAIDALKA